MGSDFVLSGCVEAACLLSSRLILDWIVLYSADEWRGFEHVSLNVLFLFYSLVKASEIEELVF